MLPLPLLLLFLFGSPISHVKIDCNVHSVMEIYIRLCGALGVLLAKGNGPAEHQGRTAGETAAQQEAQQYKLARRTFVTQFYIIAH